MMELTILTFIDTFILLIMLIVIIGFSCISVLTSDCDKSILFGAFVLLLFSSILILYHSNNMEYNKFLYQLYKDGVILKQETSIEGDFKYVYKLPAELPASSTPILKED